MNSSQGILIALLLDILFIHKEFPWNPAPEEEIDRFTSAPEGSAQPSSQAQAQGLDRLDHLIARVKQMYGMLESHV